MNDRLKFLHDCLDPGTSDFWYLAGPYSGNEDYNFAEHERALVCLLRNKIWAYSPIVHCHAFATRYLMPTDAAFWKDYNETMMRGAYGVLVYKLPKWELSRGTLHEIDFANRVVMPLEYIELSDID